MLRLLRRPINAWTLPLYRTGDWPIDDRAAASSDISVRRRHRRHVAGRIRESRIRLGRHRLAGLPDRLSGRASAAYKGGDDQDKRSHGGTPLVSLIQRRLVRAGSWWRPGRRGAGLPSGDRARDAPDRAAAAEASDRKRIV